jgi:lipoprotein-anchoring transpeptidase ErfK/SrfK
VRSEGVIRLPLLAFSLVFTLFAADPAGAAEAAKPRSKGEMEAATRLQVFLDRAEFAPGKIDGRYGEFTVKALALYRQSKGEAAPSTPPAPDSKNKKQPAKAVAPDVTGLDLASVDPVFQTYTVTEADLQSIGELPDEVPAQAKLKSLPYRDAAEAIAEKFHIDIDFLAELNPGKTKAIKAGDTLTVPNVEAFELAAVKDLKAGSEIPGQAANEVDEAATQPKAEGGKKEKEAAATPPPTAVKIDTKTNMLAVYDGDKLIAAFPVTIGSGQTESPIGDWTVRGVAKMPNFRYDKAMLNKGERSNDFHILPPGPNNPVGVIWIQLNKKGIGLHGTNDPDAIGRNASHGCVRLANWDIVRLAAKVKTGVPVSIH